MIPSRAYFLRTLPSHSKGVVIIPTVRMPRRLAIPATTGAPPVPVPPPIPAVTKIISALSTASSISCRFSSTASRPISGRAPAPRPLVNAEPTWILISALLFFRAWASVFKAIYSTLSSPIFIILLMALPPPPPTPITLILAFSWLCSSKWNRELWLAMLTPVWVVFLLDYFSWFIIDVDDC